MPKPTMTPAELRAHRQNLTVLAVGVAAIIAIGAILVFSRPARSHGPAHWIQFSPTASWCCTVGDDCRRRDPGFAVESKDGWTIVSTGEFFPHGDRRLFKSIDNDPWACDAPDGTHRCLFVPGSGA